MYDATCALCLTQGPTAPTGTTALCASCRRWEKLARGGSTAPLVILIGLVVGSIVMPVVRGATLGMLGAMNLIVLGSLLVGWLVGFRVARVVVGGGPPIWLGRTGSVRWSVGVPVPIVAPSAWSLRDGPAGRRALTLMPVASFVLCVAVLVVAVVLGAPHGEFGFGLLWGAGTMCVLFLLIHTRKAPLLRTYDGLLGNELRVRSRRTQLDIDELATIGRAAAELATLPPASGPSDADRAALLTAAADGLARAQGDERHLALLRLGTLLAELDHGREAQECLEAVLAAHPASLTRPEIVMLVTTAMVVQGGPVAASARADTFSAEAYRVSGRAAEATMMRAAHLLERGEVDRARTLLEPALRWCQSAEARAATACYLARAHWMGGDPEGAWASLAIAEASYPSCWLIPSTRTGMSAPVPPGPVA